MLYRVKLPWFSVDDTQGAKAMAFRGAEGHARVEANVGIAGDQRVIAESRIKAGVRYLHQGALLYGMGAEGEITRGFLRIQAHPTFEPLAPLIDQRNQRNGHLQPERCQGRDVIKGLFAVAVHDLILRQCREAQLFAGRVRRDGHHAVSCGGVSGLCGACGAIV